MFLEYDEMPVTSKVLIYLSSRKFYDEEIKEIASLVKDFIQTWQIEGNKLVGSFTLKYNRFIIILIDKDKNDGLLTTKSIDKCVEFILKLEKKYVVSLVDTMNVCFKQGDYVQYKDIREFKKLIKKRSVSKNTIVFNNLMNTKEELENYWEIPLIDSWQNRYL